MLAWPKPFVPLAPTGVRFNGLHLFDSFSNSLSPVSDVDPFTMYVCGITPYDATHIGHAATYLSFDLIHRYLHAAGRSVRFLENVTDIDDPLFERARRDGLQWEKLGREQVRLFVADMANLRVLPPYELMTVTTSMPRIIGFISALIAEGLSYHLDGDLYLDATKVTDFSDLPLAFDEALLVFRERGGDPDRAGKRHPLDPLLWRHSAPDEPRWEASFGSGRPGWHVECNAISSALLGDGTGKTLSLQGGGADLLFPHHYMTALQGRARHKVAFARHYAHAGMIRYRGEKMSKSLGNLVFVSELIAGGLPPMAIRLALLSGHYRLERDWSDSVLSVGRDRYEAILRLLSREQIPDYTSLMQAIADALADDLDTPSALRLLDEFILKVEKSEPDPEWKNPRSPGNLSRFLDGLLGLTF